MAESAGNRYSLNEHFSLQLLGAAGLVLLLITGELVPTNVVGFCIAASNAFGLITGKLLSEPQ